MNQETVVISKITDPYHEITPWLVCWIIWFFIIVCLSPRPVSHLGTSLFLMVWSSVARRMSVPTKKWSHFFRWTHTQIPGRWIAHICMILDFFSVVSIQWKLKLGSLFIPLLPSPLLNCFISFFLNSSHPKLMTPPPPPIPHTHHSSLTPVVPIIHSHSFIHSFHDSCHIFSSSIFIFILISHNRAFTVHCLMYFKPPFCC